MTIPESAKKKASKGHVLLLVMVVILLSSALLLSGLETLKQSQHSVIEFERFIPEDPANFSSVLDSEGFNITHVIVYTYV